MRLRNYPFGSRLEIGSNRYILVRDRHPQSGRVVCLKDESAEVVFSLTDRVGQSVRVTKVNGLFGRVAHYFLDKIEIIKEKISIF